MEDRDIVTLYWQRDEEAIRQTDRQYGRYLSAIAFHILADREDSRETVNDTYLRAWGSMPPHRPRVLSTYLGHITRQLSIDRWRRRRGRTWPRPPWRSGCQTRRCGPPWRTPGPGRPGSAA